VPLHVEDHHLQQHTRLSLCFNSKELCILPTHCTVFCWESAKERDLLEDKGVDGRMGDGLGGMDCTQMAQDKGRWRPLVNTVMNLRVLAPWI
jgi:hypothetical protein